MKLLLKGWSRIWTEGGFRGASKKFEQKDGTMCYAIIRDGLVTIQRINDSNSNNTKITHIILSVSVENLNRFFQKNYSVEIFEVYSYLN